MDFETILPIIFSSAVISAIISFFSSKKDREVSGISSERAIWGNGLRDIAEQIRNSNDNRELLKLLDMLIVRINPLGKVNVIEQPKDLSAEIRPQTLINKIQKQEVFLQIENKTIKLRIKKIVPNTYKYDLKKENEIIINKLRNVQKKDKGVLEINGRSVFYKVKKVIDNTKRFGETLYTQRDCFLWDNIKHIKNKINNGKEVTDYDKDELIYSISITLKQNWEQSKIEIRGSISNLISIVCGVIVAISIIYLTFRNGNTLPNNQIMYTVLFVTIVLAFNRLLDWRYDVDESNLIWYIILVVFGMVVLGIFYYMAGATFFTGCCLILVYVVSFLSGMIYDINKGNTSEKLYTCILKTDFMKKNSGK